MQNPGSKSEISEQRLVDDLQAIGITSGDHVALGISFRSLGRVVGGADTFVNALLKAVGPSGTIMVNTFTEQFSISRIKAGGVDYVFDHRSTPCNTGLISETVRKRHDALRSQHPVTSIAAIGRLAPYLTEGHGPDASAYSPFTRLAECNGKYLAIGIGNRLVGLRHEAQYNAGLLDLVPKKQGVNYRSHDGSIKFFVNKNPPGCVRTLGRLADHLKQAGVVNEGKIGEAASLLVPAGDALSIMTNILKETPTLNLCDELSCLWCRETERRLALYGQIEHPRYFQKYKLVIAILTLLNRFRLGDSWMATQLIKATNLFRQLTT
jgi:aminoglycoside 3-N-acetyltransferase